MKRRFTMPPQITCASALPVKMGKHENHIFHSTGLCYTHNAPVHCLPERNKKASIHWQDKCAANYRLLANQWAECRLVAQWRHGCRAMRRNVCNAVASNVGRSLCVQISREGSYHLPIYWYHAIELSRSKFLYNETLQQTFRPLLSKLSKRRQIIPILRKLGAV